MRAVNNNGRGRPRILQTYRKQYDNTGISKLTATKFKTFNDPRAVRYSVYGVFVGQRFMISTDFMFVLSAIWKISDQFNKLVNLIILETV